MSITYLEHTDGIKRLVNLLHNENLTPIIGSGFTRGCKTKRASVPDGTQVTQLMKDIICKFKQINLANADFNKVSDRFFSIVPKEQQWDFFETYFTQVTLHDYLSVFLALPWPYIYTLNIDDAIERTGIYKAVLPYQNAKVPNTAMKLVYKLHGDAEHEILYRVQKNIVFSVNQYIEFLTSPDNTTVFNSISGDYTQKNLLFIGCSLANEPDLKYIYSHIEEDVSPNVLRCIIRTKQLDVDEEINLEGYGINTVIVVNDYELFYRDFVREYENLAAKEVGLQYQFTNPKIVSLDAADKDLNIKYILGESIFELTKNVFYKSNLQVVRNCVKDIEACLEKNNCVIIQGRRFSGKTFLLSILADRYKKYTTMYFPSEFTIDEDVLQTVLENSMDTLFLFDSNSLSSYAYQVVAHSGDLLEQNNNKLAISINSNDTYLSDTLDAETIHLPPVFFGEELKSLNPACDRYGLLKRRPKETNVDYLKRLNDEQKIDFSLFSKLPKRYSQQELVLLMLLCIKDKLYFSDISALGIRFHDVDDFISRLQGLVERVPTSKGEKTCHAAEKLVHNSKYYLLSLMRDFSKDEIISTVTYIVSKLSRDKSRRRLYIETVLFDTLNQLFGHTQGAGRLILELYEALDPYLNQDMDYWLQRAKSIYRIYPNHYDKLKTAYQYAKKASGDGNLRIQAKASLTTSLICCLLANQCQDAKDEYNYEVEAITSAESAIASEYFRLNQKNLKGDLGIGVRDSYFNLIIKVCNKHADTSRNLQTAWTAAKVKKELITLSSMEQ